MVWAQRSAMRLRYIYTTCLLVFGVVVPQVGFGLEFGVMGNVSAGMGGAGVALKNSPFALYYNPALLSAANSIRFGYSVGIGMREKGFDKIANIDLNNFSNAAGNFVDLLGGFSGGSSGSVDDFSTILDKALDSVSPPSGGGGDLQSKFENFKNTNGDWNVLISAIQNQTNSSSLTDEQKNLVNNIADNINFGDLNLDTGSITGISINFGGDVAMDKAIRDLQTIQDVLRANSFNFTSQNGVALQFAPSFLRGTLGTFGVGLFSSFYGGTSIKADPNRMDLILESGGNYYKVHLGDNGFGYAQTDRSDYEAHSLEYALQQGAHSLTTHMLWINEIPIGYAHTFYFKNVNLNLGISARLMSASNAQNNTALTTNTNFVTSGKNIISKDAFETKAGIAIDLGTMLEIDLPDFRYLTFGFVAKNINTPTFRYANGELAIKPQYRAGFAYNQNNFVFAFDADLVKNEMFSDSINRPFSQMIGGGVKFDIKMLDLRLGLMKDIRQDDGLIITGGINLLGFLDVAVQAGTELGEAKGYRFPRYLNIRVGGNFSF